MRNISKLVAFTTFAGAAAAGISTPTIARAQVPGQLVQDVAKLNSGNLALVRRLVDDQAFADQFSAAMQNGDTDGAANLVASATGLSRASIAVHQGGRGSSRSVPAETGFQHVSLRRQPLAG